MMAEPGGGEPRIDVILGRCDDMRAEVYVRATGLPATAEPAAITGTLTGPESRLAITLPTSARLVDLGPGPIVPLGAAFDATGGSALGRAILTEPGYWTPELAHRYRLTAEVRAGGVVMASCDRLVGLRRLGIRGRSLWLEGRRWVPRGVACAAGDLEPAVFRELLAAAVLDEPADATCAAADEAGVAIIARCGRDPLANCLRWARHSSVMLAVLPGETGTSALTAQIAAIKPFQGTMLIALEVTGTKPPPDSLPHGVDCLVISLAEGGLPHGAWRQPPPLPILVARPGGGDLRDRRAACDRLQADLATWRGTVMAPWEPAGFISQPQTSLA